jgi:hypothetical protein
MKIATRILAVWGCVATLSLLCLLCVYLDREGIVEFRRHRGVDYYYPADLQTMNLPPWNLTNAIPLSPDAAMRAAMHYASEKHPGITTWEADRISLEKEGDGGIWAYEIDLIDRQSGRYEVEGARVLMDGSIWKPTKEERRR